MFLIAVVLGTMLLQGAPVAVKTIGQGHQSGIDTPRQVTVRDPEAWAKLWREHTAHRAGDAAPPPVDFSRDMVVGVFLGTRPTAGFGVEIVEARDQGGAIVVAYRESRPPPGAITAQVLTAPYHLVSVPKHATVTFEQVPAK